MADITVTEFRARFVGTFSDLSDALIGELIAEAYGLSDTSRVATMYCIAHLAALESEVTGAPDGGSGVVASETIGPRKVEYKTQAMASRDVFFEQTSYGRSMLARESRSPAARFSVRVA